MTSVLTKKQKIKISAMFTIMAITFGIVIGMSYMHLSGPFHLDDCDGEHTTSEYLIESCHNFSSFIKSFCVILWFLAVCPATVQKYLIYKQTNELEHV